MPKLSKADEQMVADFVEIHKTTNNITEIEVSYKKKLTKQTTFLLVNWENKNGRSWALLPYNIIIDDLSEIELLKVKPRERHVRLINILFGKYIYLHETKNISSIKETSNIASFKENLLNDVGDWRISFDREFVNNGSEMGSTISCSQTLNKCEIKITEPIKKYFVTPDYVS